MRDSVLRHKREEDFSGWYNEVIRLAYWIVDTPTPGCFIMMPPSYAIWERIQGIVDKMLKERGVKNAYFPLLIPEGLFHRESEHVEGFAPECAIVTHGGGQRLDEPLYVRPTSEVIMYEAYARMIGSWRDLPLLLNQWANVVRWEKRPRPFIRTLEFLWQEGHCAHATHEESLDWTLMILNDVYKKLIWEYLAIPVLVGAKPDNQKFAGAVTTYTLEALMGGKALQMATSHDLGQTFARAFDIKYQDGSGTENYVWQNSWGSTTRLLGAIAMVHGDDKGLVLPPSIAPIQAMIIPIARADDRSEVMCYAQKLQERLTRQVNLRSQIDERDISAPRKFIDAEISGIPMRLEVGMNEVRNMSVTVVVRHDHRRLTLPVDYFIPEVGTLLWDIMKNMSTAAQQRLVDNTHDLDRDEVDTYGDFVERLSAVSGFVGAYICGQKGCSHSSDVLGDGESSANFTSDDWIQAQTGGATGRVLAKEGQTGRCLRCGRPGSPFIYYAKAY